MTMAMELIRHIAGLYGGKAIKGDFTQVYITGNEIWMAQQVLAEQAKGAQGELEAFESWWSNSGLTKFKDTAQAAWEARAALAQPSPARCQCCGYLVTDSEHRGCLRAAYPVVVTKNDDGQIVAVTRQDAEGQVVDVIAEAQPSPAPELDFSKPLETEKGEPLMTVAQHDRIVAALLRQKSEDEAELAKYARIVGELRADLAHAIDNAQAGQVPEGYALIPTRMLLDKELIECIAFHCGDGGGSYGDYQDGILFIGEIRDDDGRIVHGLHLACAECEEEGYTTLVEFAAAPQPAKGE